MAELVTIYAKNKEIGLAAVSETDKAVHEYIFSEKDRNQDEGRFPVYLALSELRRGLFSWYDFGREASILEIGGGYGALTGLFCERAREVVVTERSPYRAQIIQKRYEDRDNLSVYVGDILEMTFEKKFDYIILTGILERAGKGSFDREPYVSYLQSLQQFLKPGGILLAAVDNRYGLRYFAGMKNIHTGKVFDSIRKYPEGNRGAHSFTRKEIDEIWEQAGFDAKKVYYPLPDYRGLGKVLYAAVSTDRGKERSFATVIYEDDSVAKIPLYMEGTQNMQQLCAHVQDLAARGLDVVPQTIESGRITMPRMHLPMLSNYIKDIIAQDPEQVKEIVEQLWQNILRSSNETDASKNALLTEDTKHLPWGPILQKVYMELIPLNCFYREGAFVYFDQEFVRENYPAKYALFRALHYIYCFTERAEQYIPLRYFQEKYEMDALWQIFRKEEDRFLSAVRCHEAHRVFYGWAYPDGARMQRNVDRLNSAAPSVKVFQMEAPQNSDTATGTKPYQIGYVPGVFDLFHVGHLNLIRRSKQRCEHLIVGVLTDELVEHFKHKRPHIPYEQRAAIVAAVREVDEVVPVDFHNTRKIDAWNLYHFDCHFSGNDHGPDWDRDLAQLRAVGSNMEFFEYTQGISSTQIKQQLGAK